MRTRVSRGGVERGIPAAPRVTWVPRANRSALGPAGRPGGVASRRLHGPAGMRVQDACWCEANESEGKFLALIKFIQQDLAVHLRVVGRADIRSGGRALVRSCAHWLPGTGAECRAPGVPSGPLACRAGAPWVRDAGSVCLRAVQRCCDRTHPARTRCRDRRSYRRVREWAAPHAATVTVPQVSVWGRRGAAPPRNYSLSYRKSRRSAELSLRRNAFIERCREFLRRVLQRWATGS